MLYLMRQIVFTNCSKVRRWSLLHSLCVTFYFVSPHIQYSILFFNISSLVNFCILIQSSPFGSCIVIMVSYTVVFIYYQVKFEKKVYPEMLEIQETYNGGAVKKIEIIQPDNNWYSFWKTYHVSRRQFRNNLRFQVFKSVSNL